MPCVAQKRSAASRMASAVLRLFAAALIGGATYRPNEKVIPLRGQGRKHTRLTLRWRSPSAIHVYLTFVILWSASGTPAVGEARAARPAIIDLNKIRCTSHVGTNLRAHLHVRLLSARPSTTLHVPLERP